MLLRVTTWPKGRGSMIEYVELLWLRIPDTWQSAMVAGKWMLWWHEEQPPEVVL